MADVLAAVDSVTGAFGTLVQNRLHTDMQTAINAGVTAAISGSGDTATAVANAVTAMTTPTILKAAGVLPTTARNAITGWYHCDGYGAIGDGATNTRTQIQAALDAAEAAYGATGAVQTVYLPPGVYSVDAVAFYLQSAVQDGICSLKMHSGIRFTGGGTIKVKAGAYGSGASYAAIRSNSEGISNASISGITIDGNRANQVASQQCSNIVLDAATNVEVVGTTQIAANGTAIMIRGTTANIATNIRIASNKVFGANTIGLQCSQFDGLEITNNFVGGTTDNAIDIYGENGTTTAHAGNFNITGNHTFGGIAGIFLETVNSGIVASNWINSATNAGVHVNRINGEPNRISIAANSIDYSPSGITVTGDSGGVNIRSNVITRATVAGINLGGGGGRVSGVNIFDNSIDTLNLNSVPLVLVALVTTQWDRSKIRRTATFNTNHAYDVVNYATVTTSSVSYDASNS